MFFQLNRSNCLLKMTSKKNKAIWEEKEDN